MSCEGQNRRETKEEQALPWLRGLVPGPVLGFAKRHRAEPSLHTSLAVSGAGDSQPAVPGDLVRQGWEARGRPEWVLVEAF